MSVVFHERRPRFSYQSERSRQVKDKGPHKCMWSFGEEECESDRRRVSKMQHKACAVMSAQRPLPDLRSRSRSQPRRSACHWHASCPPPTPGRFLLAGKWTVAVFEKTKWKKEEMAFRAGCHWAKARTRAQIDCNV